MAARILIADDEAYLAKILQFTLEHAGYEVVLAYDGNEALETARREKPALVILDLMLPGIDGYKVCSILKSDAEFGGVPVIIISARDLEREYIEGKITADYFIEKPFDIGRLVNIVSGILGRGVTGA